MESHNINLSFFMKDTYFKIEKKMEALYDNYLNISEEVFNGKNSQNNFEYRNIFMTIANQNHFFDISTMSSSIENRAPLLDYRLVEYMLSISKVKKNKNGIKSLYKKLLSNILPSFIIDSKKSGPSLPINIWLKQDPDFRDKVLLYIKNNISYVNDYLSVDLAKSLVNEEIDTIDKNFIIRFRIFCMIIWFKIKIEQSIKNPTISLVELLK
jgi:asparagine synthetase B (glutamine-hydrolysing)